MLDTLVYMGLLRPLTVTANGIEEAKGHKSNAGTKLHIADKYE
jgi:hypothetical protein